MPDFTQDANQTITWTSAELESTERLDMSRTPGGWLLQGEVQVPFDGVPGQISYSVVTNHKWQTSSADITIETASFQRVLSLLRAPSGWTLDGVPLPELHNCADIDFGWTSATNTLPIRRLDLAVGAAGAATAAWIRFPELTIEPLEQSYRRLATDRYLYESPSFKAELVTNNHGLVTRYGDNLWVATHAD